MKVFNFYHTFILKTQINSLKVVNLSFKTIFKRLIVYLLTNTISVIQICIGLKFKRSFKYNSKIGGYNFPEESVNDEGELAIAEEL